MERSRLLLSISIDLPRRRQPSRPARPLAPLLASALKQWRHKTAPRPPLTFYATHPLSSRHLSPPDKRLHAKSPPFFRPNSRLPSHPFELHILLKFRGRRFPSARYFRKKLPPSGFRDTVPLLSYQSGVYPPHYKSRSGTFPVEFRPRSGGLFASSLFSQTNMRTFICILPHFSHLVEDDMSLFSPETDRVDCRLIHPKSL